jgi:hypothetical protein
MQVVAAPARPCKRKIIRINMILKKKRKKRKQAKKAREIK